MNKPFSAKKNHQKPMVPYLGSVNKHDTVPSTVVSRASVQVLIFARRIASAQVSQQAMHVKRRQAAIRSYTKLKVWPVTLWMVPRHTRSPRTVCGCHIWSPCATIGPLTIISQGSTDWPSLIFVLSQQLTTPHQVRSKGAMLSKWIEYQVHY